MASYQDLDPRVAALEDKLDFVMRTFRMHGVVSNGVLGPNGQPVGQPLDGTLLDFYHLQKRNDLTVVRDADVAPAAVTE